MYADHLFLFLSRTVHTARLRPIWRSFSASLAHIFPNFLSQSGLIVCCLTWLSLPAPAHLARASALRRVKQRNSKVSFHGFQIIRRCCGERRDPSSRTITVQWVQL
ncbi:uncharacterized protein SPPG_09583 [Spizellomyces punctatus DAOM BR117]|uniref:Uncharacterized protein n=1 Tax=Spizellomyces punctatus (strain DAOM BR117) TaxID=645134 RepID=A0A0L0H3M7_SPIPD|nr:uncharacterized protein SPPG_09583 [Spizellomyces punctatus DAOM BR117]KNC95807.1 hypothetical protein SPPG_09583 [Spizellomyces punctatus DAOM BR117]|eukprot:XP_016603847.1 hypothetical protein SPPG_09583 [Spizellomyces punctatus DAOM BR117]